MTSKLEYIHAIPTSYQAYIIQKKERKTIKIHYFCQMLLRIKETQFDRHLQLGPEDYFM